MAAGLPTSWTVEVEFSAGSWTDVSASVNGREGVKITRGRQARSDETQPGTCGFLLDNDTGAFTPDNPLSAYWPNVVEGKQIRVKVTKGSTSQRFLGRVSVWEPDFTDPDPAQAKVRVTAVDALAVAARVMLRSLLTEEILADGASHLWTLAESGSPTVVADSIGRAAPLALTQIGTGGKVDWSSLTTPDGATCASFVPNAGLNGLYLRGAVPVGTRTGLTLEALVRYSNQGSQRVAASIGMDVGPRLFLLVAPEGWITAAVGDSRAGIVGSVTTGDTPALLGQWNHVMATVDADYVRLYVNGVDRGGAVVTSAVAGLLTAGDVLIGGDPVGSVFTAGLFTGEIASVVVTGKALSSARAAAHARAAVDNVSTLLERWTDIATIVGLTGTVDAAWTSRTAAAPRTAGKSGLTALQDVMRGESTFMWADPSNASTVVGRSRATARSSSVALTVDVEADGDGGLIVGRSQNDKAARVDVDNGTSVVSRSDSSIIDGGALTLAVALASSDEMAAIATDRLAASRFQRLGVSTVRADLVTAQGSYLDGYADLYAASVDYAAFWALNLGDRVRISGLPAAQIGVSYVDTYVQGWTEHWTVDRALVDLYLSPADAPAELTNDDAVLSRCSADGTMTLTADITSTATSVQVTTSGSNPTLTTDAAMYPLDLDINGERVTVASAPASSTSPQTVTVTRGVAPSVARAHSAGEAVDVWLAPGVAF